MMYKYFAGLVALLCVACQIPLENYEQVDKREFLQFEIDITPSYARGTITKTSAVLVGNTRIQRPTFGITEMYVKDSKGLRTDLPLDGSIDNNFRGIVGETYQFFATVEGKQYQSKPEKLSPVPPIDTVFYQFNSRNDLLEESLVKHGFDVYVKFRDLPGHGQYYNWTWVNFTKRYRCSTKTLRNTLYNVGCEVDCWDINRSPNITLFTDRVTDGGSPSIQLARIPYFIPPNQYYFSTEQRSITEHVFDYLLSARDQTQTNGGQFDVPAQTQFSTNISCVTDPDEVVLGVLNVFSFDRKLIYIDRSIMFPNIKVKRDNEITRPPYQCNPAFPPPCTAPCPETKFTTRVKPEGWRE